MTEINKFDDDIVVSFENDYKAFAFDLENAVYLARLLKEFELNETRNEHFSIVEKVEDNDVGCFSCGDCSENLYTLRNHNKGDVLLFCESCHEEFFETLIEYIDNKIPEIVIGDL